MSELQLSDNIIPIAIEDEMKRSYLDYSMSVIVSRALPDVRDGLKPVHRRILFAMKDGGYDYNKPHKKSARIVGEVMSKYHPHGNMPIYDAMARMAQDFSMNITLVDGQGNFGSMDGDPPAAERYTEARLEKIAHELLVDIDKDTVIFQQNYDGSCFEPTVLPARFPNLLVNGTSGIAVGMATNIPPHNLGELLDACIELVQNPNLSVQELMQYVKGPDFPTGACIIGQSEIVRICQTGHGSVIVRAKAEIDEQKHRIVVTEIPYQVNKARLVEHIAYLIKDKKIEGISDIRDESNRHGVRVVFDLKREANAEVVLNQLFKFSSLQTNFSCHILALVRGVPQILSLRQCLLYFNEFRQEVIVKRTRYFLQKARDKAHILIGFAVALLYIDKVIQIIKGASDRKDAFQQLSERCWECDSIIPYLKVLHESIAENGIYLSEIQVNAILDLRLHRLTGMEQKAIQDDLESTINQIKELTDILSSKERILEILINELKEIKDNYAIPRRTEIVENSDLIEIEDLIPREEMVITVSYGGYIKCVSLDTYRSQARGGKGRSGMAVKEEDVVNDIFVANTHARVLFFSSLGKVYKLPVYKLPQGTPQSRGRAMVNVLPLQKNEKISSVLVLPDQIEDDKSLLFVTSKGNVRRNRLADFDRVQANGKRAMILEDDEKLIGVALCDTNNDILLNTRFGYFIRFKVSDLRIFSGRTSTGVRGIKLGKEDAVISMAIMSAFNVKTEERIAYLKRVRGSSGEDEEGDFEINDDRFQEMASKEQFILTITEKGYGKRSSAYEYRTTGRGGRGTNGILIGAKNGNVVGAFPIDDDDDIIVITDKGRLLRCTVAKIRVAGRRTQGVIVLRIEEGEKVVGVSRIKENT